MSVADGLWTGDPAVRIAGARTGADALRAGAEPIARRVASLPGSARVIRVSAENCLQTLAALYGTWRGGGVAALADPSWPPALADRAAALLGSGLRDVSTLPKTEAAPMPVDGDEPFLIGFTSGSTGAPRAWRRCHRSWSAFFQPSRAAFDLDADSRVLAPGSLATTLTLFPVVLALDSGAEAWLLPHFEADACRAAAADATHLFAVPTMLHRLVGGRPLRRLRQVISAGAKLDPGLRARLADTFPDARVVEYYGASELGFVSIAGPDAPPHSVGRPFPGVDVSVSPKHEIRIRSAGVIDQLIGGGEDSDFRIDPDGWATVGDTGRIDANGFLHIDGRAGEMILSGGVNVYPAEVEAALLSIDGIAGAAVFGLPDPEWGTAVCAALLLDGDVLPDRAAIRDACAAVLLRAKCPRRLFRLDSMPLTVSGKIARSALRAAVDQLEEVT